MTADLCIRRAVPADAASLAALRVALARGEGRVEGLLADDYLARCEAFFRHALADGCVRSWLALDRALVVGAASLELHPTFPRPRGGRSLDGRVRSVYVVPSHRRRGIARALMREVLAEARRESVDRLRLGSSAMGRALYESLGFAERPNEMLLGDASAV
jgi:GNAT superfamily N-acetyltransferase